MIDRPYRTAALAALLLFCCLALSASSALPARAADEELEPGIGDAPRSDRLPDGGDSEEGGTAAKRQGLDRPSALFHAQQAGPVRYSRQRSARRSRGARRDAEGALHATERRSQRQGRRADRRGDRGDVAPLGQRYRRPAHDPRRCFRARRRSRPCHAGARRRDRARPGERRGLASARHRAFDAERYRAGARRSQARDCHRPQPL